MDRPQRVALALGSGGARGYAHIGAIQALEERGLQIVGVAGSSMGALVGGIYAAGKLGEFTDWALALTQIDVVRLLGVSLTSPGAIRPDKVLAYVSDLLGGRQIEELTIPFTAVATDLEARREVWFQRGPVDLAISASIALPGIFPPVSLNGRLLADGGLMEPIPVAPTAALGADITVAISLGGERHGPPEQLAHPDSSGARAIDDLVARFRRGATQALETDFLRSALSWRGSGGGSEGDSTGSDSDAVAVTGLTRFDVMNYAPEAMQTLVTDYRLAGFPPDILVTVPKDACRTLDFHRAAALIELGRTLTAEALDAAGIVAADVDPRR